MKQSLRNVILVAALVFTIVSVGSVVRASDFASHWSIETRFYDADQPRPEHWSGRANGTFDDSHDTGAMTSHSLGYDDVRIMIVRDGLAFHVEVDVIRDTPCLPEDCQFEIMDSSETE